MKVRMSKTVIYKATVSEEGVPATTYRFEVSENGLVHKVTWFDCGKEISITNFDLRAILEVIKLKGWRLEAEE